jgi:hypothetical protein
VVNFKNTIIILTSNIGAQYIDRMEKIGFTSDPSDQTKYQDVVLKALGSSSKPVFDYVASETKRAAELGIDISDSWEYVINKKLFVCCIFWDSFTCNTPSNERIIGSNPGSNNLSISINCPFF